MPSIRGFWRRLKAGPKFDLHYLLERADPSASFVDRVEFCERLLDWVRYTSDGKTSVSARVRFLLQILERNPEWKVASGKVIRSVVSEAVPYQAFYETGIPHGQTFGKEIAARIFQILVPVSEDSVRLHAILLRIFYDSQDPEWLALVPIESWKEIIDDWIFPDPVRLPAYETALADAALALSVQGAALSLRTDFVERSPEFGLESHPFLHLEAQLAVLSAQARRDPQVRDRSEIVDAIRGTAREIERARALIQSVRAHIEEFGVSVDLVYEMDRMKLYLERIEFLVRTLSAALTDRSKTRVEALSLFKALVTGLRYDEDFRFVFRKSLRLLATKIVERTGNSGERYFTSNWFEWKHLFWAAAGGGALTGITAMMKSFTPHDPPFMEFVFSAFNYAGSFVVMHLLGLKLATKQPSMTAAALAGRLLEVTEEDVSGKQRAFVQEVARIARAQFAAVLGNLALVVPSAFVIDLLWLGAHGGHFYSAAKGMATLENVSLFGSGTIWYAALTGVILWVSSLGAGYAENFFVLIRLPDLLANHRILRQVFGAERARRFGDALLRNTAGIAGSVFLGILLAAAPVMGDFFGLPIDARHVTLTTGTLTFAFLGMGTFHGIIRAFLSVAIIGSLNFGVSFLFAVLTAFRARNIELREALALFRHSFRVFIQKPWFFLFPNEKEEGP